MFSNALSGKLIELDTTIELALITLLSINSAPVISPPKPVLIVILPLPVMLKPFKSKLPPNWGVVSSTMFLRNGTNSVPV